MYRLSKVLNHQYADIIEIDGEEESIKRNTLKIYKKLSKSLLEGKAKVYILKNVEKTTKEAMNALLKILEEPTEGIYAILQLKISTVFYQRLYLDVRL